MNIYSFIKLVMKKNYFWASMFCLSLGLLSACSSDDDSQKSLELTGGTTTSQTIYADETSKGEGIKFTASAAWSATVKPVGNQARASEVEWLSLSAYQGGVGEFTLKMTLQPNLTGEDRKAEIIITCGDTVIRIQVEQKGTKADGQKPEGSEKPNQPGNPQGTAQRRVERIIFKEYDECVGPGLPDKVLNLQIGEIAYNEEGKFTLFEVYQDVNTNYIIDAEERIPANLLHKTEVNYDSNARTAQATATSYAQGKVDYVHTRDMKLNEAGHVVESISETNHDGFLETYYITYQDGYIASSKAKETGDDTYFLETPVWQNGCLVKVSSGREGKTYGWSDVVYGNEPNPNISIDINFLIANSEWHGCLAEDENSLKPFGLYGKRSQYLMVKETDNQKEENDQEIYEYTYKKNKEGLIESIDVKAQYKKGNYTEEFSWILQYQE